MINARHRIRLTAALVLLFAPPAWAELPPGAVVYGVVPQLFGEEPLRAVTSRLDEIRAQGVDALWLPPVMATDDPSFISYAITDYFSLRPDLGTPGDLKRLVREAHRRGMQVLLDIVPNHTSSGHPYFIDAQKRGRASPYFDHYDRDSRGKPTHYFHWENLPNLNFENPAATGMISRAFRYWIEEYGIDGFRVDAAWGVRQRSPEFFPRLKKELQEIRPRLVLVAEAGARDPYYVTHGFDFAYDWSGKLGEWSWKEVFENPSRAPELLDVALRAEKTADRTLRFLNNNDTGERFVSRHGVGMTRVAAVLQHTLPGLALVYTGDELGAEYDPYADPPPIAWKDRHGLRSHYRKLAELRETIPALRSGELVLLPPKKGQSSTAYFRSTVGSELLVILNFGEKGITRVDIPERFRGAFLKGKLRDLLSGKIVWPSREGKALALELPKYASVILVSDAVSSEAKRSPGS